MIIRTTVVALLVVTACFSCSRVPSDLQLTGEFERVRCVDGLPRPVLYALFGGSDDNPPSVYDAMPLHGFYHGLKPRLHIELKYAAHKDPYWIVVYEAGSFARINSVAVVRLDDGRAGKRWSFMGSPQGQTIDKFLARLESGDRCFASPPRIYFVEEDRQCSGDPSPSN